MTPIEGAGLWQGDFERPEDWRRDHRRERCDRYYNHRHGAAAAAARKEPRRHDVSIITSPSAPNVLLALLPTAGAASMARYRRTIPAPPIVLLAASDARRYGPGGDLA